MRVNLENVAELVLKLPPLEKGETVDIDNLYFVGNQAVLLKKPLPELPKVLKFMQINSNIKIAGHINRPKAPPVTKESWDYHLSLRRAKFVYNYLIENGIAESRLTYKGYGNWEMRFPQATSLQDQSANRRVEIRILERGN